MASLSHTAARKIVADAWRQVHGRDPTAKEALYTQAIAFLESGYGRAGQFGAMAAKGQFNWGALERKAPTDGVCPPGTAPGSDQGDVCFLVFPSDTAAASAFIQNLTKRHWPTIQAMTGTPEDVARAMRVPPPYYNGVSGSNEQRIQVYATAIRNAAHAIQQQVPDQVGLSSGSSFPWLGVGLVGTGLYLWYRKYGTRGPWQPGFRF